VADHVRPWLRIVFLIIAFKAVLFGAAALSLHLLPPIFSAENYLDNFHWPANELPNPTWILKTWDTAHYVYLSENGYADALGTAAFFPLWPIVIRTLTPVVGSTLCTGYLLANLLSVLGWTLFFRLAADMVGERSAEVCLVLALAFPGALFFCFPYSESLFLFIAVAVFSLVARDKLALAAAVSIFAPMTRAVGVFLVIPLAWRAISDWKNGIRPFWHLVFAIAPTVGLGLTLLIMWTETGDPLIGFEAQKMYVAGGSIQKILFPFAFLASFVDVRDVHSVLNSSLDRIFFLIALVGLLVTARFERKFGPMTAFSAAMIIVPAVTNSMVSFIRYAAVVFPVFIASGSLIASPSSRTVRWLILTVFMMLQFFFLIRHINSYWVA